MLENYKIILENGEVIEGTYSNLTPILNSLYKNNIKVIEVFKYLKDKKKFAGWGTLKSFDEFYFNIFGKDFEKLY